MSRTYRKNSFKVGSSDEKYIQNTMKEEYRKLQSIGLYWVPKSKEEYEEEYRIKKQKYNEEMIKYNLLIESEKSLYQRLGYSENTIKYLISYSKRPYFYVDKYKRVEFDLTYEEFFDKYLEKELGWFFKRNRDGKMKQTTSSKGYKKDSKKYIRNQTKNNINKLKKDIEACEDMVWANDKDGSQFRWDWF